MVYTSPCAESRLTSYVHVANELIALKITSSRLLLMRVILTKILANTFENLTILHVPEPCSLQIVRL